VKAVDDIADCPMCTQRIEGVAVPARVNDQMEWVCSTCTFDVVRVP
jgi:hypothetical protein